MSSWDNKILIIKQTEEFKCIGPDCTDTCCAGWSVPLDTIAFERWERHPDFSELKKNLDIPEDRERSASCAAHLKKKEGTSSCIFLDSNRLCSLQVTYGHDFLSNTCKKYPRVESSVDSVFERSYTLSCPVAAGLQLKNRNGLDLDVVDSEEGPGPFYRIIIKDDNSSYNSENRFSLRVFALRIIQDRRFSIPDRLILLGMFSEALQNAINMESSIKVVFDEFQELLSDPSDSKLNDSLKHIPDAPESKQFFLELLVDAIMPYAKNHETYSSFFNSWVSGIQYDLKMKSFKSDRYKKLRTRFLEEFDYEHVLENYLFHKIFSNQFPVFNENPLHEFFQIALSYCLIREHIIGMYQEDKKVFEDDIIHLIQSYTRNHDHNEKLRASINSILDKNLINSLAHFCILIRD